LPSIVGLFPKTFIILQNEMVRFARLLFLSLLGFVHPFNLKI